MTWLCFLKVKNSPIFSHFRPFFWPNLAPDGKFYQNFSKSVIRMTFAIKRYITWPYRSNSNFRSKRAQFGPKRPKFGQIWVNRIFFRNTICSFHEYLSPYRKLLKTVKPFTRKTIFKIRAFWLVESVFGHNSRNIFFFNLKKFQKISTINTLLLRPFWAKTNDTIFLKKSKTLIFGTFS